MDLDDYINKKEEVVKIAKAEEEKKEIDRLEKIKKENRDPKHPENKFLFELSRTNISREKQELIRSVENHIMENKKYGSNVDEINRFGENIAMQQIRAADGGRMGVLIDLNNPFNFPNLKIYQKAGSQSIYVLNIGDLYLKPERLFYTFDGFIFLSKETMDFINDKDVNDLGNRLAEAVMEIKGIHYKTLYKGYEKD